MIIALTHPTSVYRASTQQGKVPAPDPRHPAGSKTGTNLALAGFGSLEGKADGIKRANHRLCQAVIQNGE